MNNILVTGGAGFVGAYVVRALLEGGHRVIVYDMSPAQNTLGMLITEGDRQPIVERGAITDGWKLLRVCREYDIQGIVHLASPLLQDVAADPSGGIRDICLGTQTIFEVAREIGVDRVVWASSIAVFGPEELYTGGVVANDASHAPESLYGHCKSLTEGLARRAWLDDGIDNVGLRFSIVYGAGRLRGYMSYPSHLLRQASAGEPITVTHADQFMCWQYVEEVAATVCRALFSEKDGQGKTFTAWSDFRRWSDVGEVLAKLKPELEITMVPGLDPELEGSSIQFDASEICTYYDYVPAWPLERGVEATLAQYVRMREKIDA